MKNKVLRVVGLMVLYIIVQVGLITVQAWPMGFSSEPMEVVRAAPLGRAAVEVWEEPTEWEFQTPKVMVLDYGVLTYTYHLDEYGHAIWKAAGVIPAGAMVKMVGGCPDGFTQVEYLDPAANGARWIVAFMKCD